MCRDMQRMPTEWEQDVAYSYVNERQMVRPNTNIKTVLISVLLFMFITAICIWGIHYVLRSVGIFAYLPSKIENFYDVHRVWSIVTLCVIVICFELLFCFKYIIIGAIKLYQHYAPEKIRRRCLFMPTCSEYTIMAVKKYGCIIGLCKSYYRSVYRCQGIIYQIDYP